jgi:hypothetical protein
VSDASFDPRAALAAKIAMDRDDYLLSCMVSIATCRRPRTAAQVYQFVVGASWNQRSHTSRADVERTLAAHEGMGWCAVIRVRGRAVRYAAVNLNRRPRRGALRRAWDVAMEHRRAIRALLRLWSPEERDAFYAQGGTP